MIRSVLSGFFLVSLMSACVSTEPTNEWASIFDGETLSGWTPKITGQSLGQDERGIFSVNDGVLRVSYDQYETFENTFGHLYFDESLSDYRLRFEYRFVGAQAVGGPAWAFMNSGVMVHAQAPETMAIDQAFPISVEAQLLGTSSKTPDRTTANICTPGTHITIEGAYTTQHCINSVTLAAPSDAWVRFEIEVRGGTLIRLFIEDEEAFTLSDPVYDTDDADVQRLNQQGDLNTGYFALQAESHPVEFRKIELMRPD